MMRRLLKFGLFLLAGAIVNVAVAWGLALQRHPARASIEGARWEGDVYCRAGLGKGLGSSQLSVFHASSPHFDLPGYSDSGPDPANFMQEWMQFKPASPAITSGEFVCERFSADARGWPALAMWRVEIHLAINSEDLSTVRDLNIEKGIKLPWTKDSIGGAIALPTRILWPGFAINTIFYAAILWLLFAAPFKVRRWRRIRRGLCPACAYPVGHSPTCTECGAALP